MDEPEKLDLRSLDITADRVDELLRLFPEVRTEGGTIDFDQLKRALGQTVDPGRERYGMTWPGKADCLKTIQAPSLATLRPSRDESVNFDTTEHVIIEGDNLEVLKLLQKSYLGQVKMIYIDPPYNTGNDFIYPDNFSESLQTYLQYTRQVDAEGRKFSTNTDADGRFHSKWLNMMYPRLYLSHNLLAEDGVILASVDDHEMPNLLRLLNEIFGEENFIANVVWEKGRKNDAKFFSVGHEYLLVFAKSQALLRSREIVWREEKPGAREIWQKYLDLRSLCGRDDNAIENEIQKWYSLLPKEHPSRKWSRYKRIDRNGPWRDRDISWPGGGGPRYDVIHPQTRKPCKVPESGWRYATVEEMDKQIRAGLVAFRDDHTEPPFRKAHIRPTSTELAESDELSDDTPDLSQDELATQVRSAYFYKQSQVAVKHLRSMFGANVFDNPKDHQELAKLFRYVLGPLRDALVLDFFAGSGTTADAVLALNREDGANHRYVLVQLPEPSPDGGRALAAGFATIADITKERVRRVIKKLNGEDAGKLDLDGTKKQDRGFRVFKLAESNFTTWDAEASPDAASLGDQLKLHVDHIRPGRTADDLLYEILLKSGFPLTTPVEITAMSGKTVHAVADGKLLICLDRELTLDLIRAMADTKPERVVCLDEGFAGNDQLKANAAQIFKTKGVTSFRTV